MSKYGIWVDDARKGETFSRNFRCGQIKGATFDTVDAAIASIKERGYTHGTGVRSGYANAYVCDYQPHLATFEEGEDNGNLVKR